MASERRIKVGAVRVGGGAPVVVQSMTLTPTRDVAATTAQIAALASAGCEVVRCAVPKIEDAEALKSIVRLSPIPVIADIHFNASLALRAIDAGVAAVRINPGNIGGPRQVEQVVTAAKQAGISMRIGANSGSLPRHLDEVARRDQAEALVAAALEEVELLERLDYRDFKISVKATHVPTMIRAYRMLAAKVPYPLHLGVTEAGTPFAGSIKSAVGIGSLLADGIGDTLRVSLTADPVKEIEVAWEILKALGPARARPGDDRLPLVRARQRRRREPRGGRRGAAARLPAGLRGRRDGLRGQRARARPATPTSGSPAGASPASSTRTAACSRRWPRRS